MGSLFGITFLNPWLLSALLILPVLYFLLRVMPPPPKSVVLATSYFLEGLTTQKRTTSKTPWWLLLLRILILTCIIFAFAHPISNKNTDFASDAPLLIVLDNSWAGASNWSDIIGKGKEILRIAEETAQPAAILLTTPLGGEAETIFRDFQDAGSIYNFLSSQQPQPWEPEFSSLRKHAENIVDGSGATFKTVWLSSGIRYSGEQGVQQYLSAESKDISLFMPSPDRSPLVIKKSTSERKSDYIVQRAYGANDTTRRTLLGVGRQNTIFAQESFSFTGNALNAEVVLNLPENTSESDINKVRIAAHDSASGTYLLSGESSEKVVGIATGESSEQNLSLNDSSYYLSKALQPYATVVLEPFSEMVENGLEKISVLIMPDISSAPPEALQKLEKWVNQGGVLLRFAGPSMSQKDMLPVPVPIQKGERVMGGGLTWEGTQKLSMFPENSPFSDLSVTNDITVRKQILARPLNSKTSSVWAQLEDGTPFITASQKKAGLVAMVHTTADPSWSDFALSGLYVDVLRRFVEMGGSAEQVFDITEAGGRYLKPVRVLNGFGVMTDPPAYAESIKDTEFKRKRATSTTPPGLYSDGVVTAALNIGDYAPNPAPVTAAGENTNISYYTGEIQKDYKNALLTLAFILFLADWIIMIFMTRLWDSLTRHKLFSKSKMNLTSLLLAACLAVFFYPSVSKAQPSQNTLLENMSSLHLAYIESGSALKDSKMREGLRNLGDFLTKRTSVEPAGVRAIDLENDDILFYPFLYWIITPQTEILSASAVSKLQNYMNNGGIIVIDLENPRAVTEGSPELTNIFKVLNGLDIPPLSPLSKDHTLKRSFYLLDTLSGRYDSQEIWSGYNPSLSKDNVDTFILTGNDLAGRWASTNGSDYGGELAIRSGINLTLYALTGNYKSDQLHLPLILERLGQ